MEYRVVSSAEFTYPDRFDYPSAAASIDLFTARGSYACCQVLLRGLSSSGVTVAFRSLPEGVTPELYSLRSVMVERNHGIPEDGRKPHWPERVAPFRVYDCLCTFDGTVQVEGPERQGGLYIALKADREAKPGVYDFTLVVNQCEIAAQLQIYAVRLPEETLKLILGFSLAPLERFHHLTPGTGAYRELSAKYLGALRRMHQNMMYVRGVRAEETEPNRWAFDFSELESMIETCRAAGMKYVFLPSVGWRESWS